MAITPLPQFEADLKEYLDEHDREAYEALKPPDSVVIRFGRMKMVGEFPYKGEEKPGCGSKLVARTHRGTELGEMLTSTCPNAGCSKSVTRKEMLEYIENSGGRDYPFHQKGRVLRVATSEDLNRQSQHDQRAHEWRMDARGRAERLGLEMKIVDAEMILGGELLTFFYTSEGRVDFRELVNELAAEHGTRIEMRQVGARDEARLTADYERCGQYCCCKNFLKVLKPVSMRSAKTQKATLDPLKISGRCGRLMCCLRYEDQTYSELKKRLPNRKKKVGTPEGDGIVIDTQILTQLVLVRLDADGRDVAIPVEELVEPGQSPKPKAPEPAPARHDQPKGDQPTDDAESPTKKRRRRRRRSKQGGGDRPSRREGGADKGTGETPAGDDRAPRGDKTPEDGQTPGGDGASGPSGQRRKRRRRRRRRGQGGRGEGGGSGDSGGGDG